MNEQELSQNYKVLFSDACVIIEEALCEVWSTRTLHRNILD